MSLPRVRLRPAEGGPAEREAVDVVRLRANIQIAETSISNYATHRMLGLLPPGLKEAVRRAEVAVGSLVGWPVLHELQSIVGRVKADAGHEGVAAALRREEDALTARRDAGPAGAVGGLKRGTSAEQYRADTMVQIALLRLLAGGVSGFTVDGRRVAVAVTPPSAGREGEQGAAKQPRAPAAAAPLSGGAVAPSPEAPYPLQLPTEGRDGGPLAASPCLDLGASDPESLRRPSTEEERSQLLATEGQRRLGPVFANLMLQGDLVHRDDFGPLLFQMLSVRRGAGEGGGGARLDADNAWKTLVARSTSLDSFKRQAAAVSGNIVQAASAGFQDGQRRALMRAVVDLLCSTVPLDFGSSTPDILAVHKRKPDCKCVHLRSGPLNMRESTCVIGQCLLRVAFDATPEQDRYFRLQKMVEELKLLTDHGKGLSARTAAAAAPPPPPSRVVDVNCVVFRPRQLTTDEVDSLAESLSAEAEPALREFRNEKMRRDNAFSSLRRIGPVLLTCRDVATKLVGEAMTQQAAEGGAVASARLINPRAWFRLWTLGVPWKRFWRGKPVANLESAAGEPLALQREQHSRTLLFLSTLWRLISLPCAASAADMRLFLADPSARSWAALAELLALLHRPGHAEAGAAGAGLPPIFQLLRLVVEWAEEALRDGLQASKWPYGKTPSHVTAAACRLLLDDERPERHHVSTLEAWLGALVRGEELGAIGIAQALRGIAMSGGGSALAVRKLAAATAARRLLGGVRDSPIAYLGASRPMGSTPANVRAYAFDPSDGDDGVIALALPAVIGGIAQLLTDLLSEEELRGLYARLDGAVAEGRRWSADVLAHAAGGSAAAEATCLHLHTPYTIRKGVRDSRLTSKRQRAVNFSTVEALEDCLGLERGSVLVTFGWGERAAEDAPTGATARAVAEHVARVMMLTGDPPTAESIAAVMMRRGLIVLPGDRGTVGAEGGPLPPVETLESILSTPGLAVDGRLRVVIAADIGRLPGSRLAAVAADGIDNAGLLFATSESSALQQALEKKAGGLEDGTLARLLAQALVSCDLLLWLPGPYGAAFRNTLAVSQVVLRAYNSEYRRPQVLRGEGTVCAADAAAVAAAADADAEDADCYPEFDGQLPPAVLASLKEAATALSDDCKQLEAQPPPRRAPLLDATDQMWKAQGALVSLLAALSYEEVEARMAAAGRRAAEEAAAAEAAVAAAEAAAAEEGGPSESGHAVFCCLRSSPATGLQTPGNIATVALQEAEAYSEARPVPGVGPVPGLTASSLSMRYTHPPPNVGEPAVYVFYADCQSSLDYMDRRMFREPTGAQRVLSGGALYGQVAPGMLVTHAHSWLIWPEMSRMVRALAARSLHVVVVEPRLQASLDMYALLRDYDQRVRVVAGDLRAGAAAGAYVPPGLLLGTAARPLWWLNRGSNLARSYFSISVLAFHLAPRALLRMQRNAGQM